MIFVTVGTHEQSFNRLIIKIDELKKRNVIQEDVFIQTGFSTYKPKYCKWEKIIPYEKMESYVKNARIVITHGGPASFIMPLQYGKIPIVVPRQKQFEEHINDHQVEFAHNVAERMGTIIPVDDIDGLENIILNYNQIIEEMNHNISSNNEEFNKKFKIIVDDLLKKKKTKRKILIVSTVGLIYDGITNVILSYLKAMDRENMEIYIAGTIKVHPRIQKRMEDLGCKMINLPNRRTEPIKYFVELSRIIRKYKIKVVHAHGNSGTLAIEMLAAWLGGAKKRIAHSHNTKCDQVKLDRILRPVFNLFYTDAFACGKEAGEWLYGNKKFTILTNGRNIDTFSFNKMKREKFRKQLNIENEIAIGHVGGFFEQKNHRFLIEIYKKIKEIRPNVKLYMIGEGPLKNEIQSLSEGLDIDFVGNIDNMSDYLNAMDGMLLPSLFEGLPLVALEWQLNGLPAILADTVTKECMISDNIEFYSLDEKAIDWAMRIIELVENNEREKSSKKAQVMAKEKGFDIKESAKMLRRVYME